MRRYIATIIIISFIITGFSIPAVASERLVVAVAANFILPSGELAKMFQEKTGIAVEVTYASTGKLFGQIVKGAPYDVFLAADGDRWWSGQQNERSARKRTGRPS